MDIGLIIGIFGLALLLISVVLNLFDVLKQSSALFVWLSIIGWLMLAYYSFTVQLWIFTTLSVALAVSELFDMKKVREYVKD